MSRSIYNFYCYRCYKQNIAAMSYPLDIDNGKIDYIFCPNCHAWIHYSNTNLSAERYKLVRKSNWNIVDEDTPEPHIIYEVQNHDIAQKLCRALNNHDISVNQLCAPCLFQTVDWFFSGLSSEVMI